MEGTFDVLQDHLASILHPPRTWSIDKCGSSWLLVWSCTAWCWRMSVMIKSMAKLGLHGPFDWALGCTVRVWRLSQYVFANPWLWCSWINPRRSTWALVDSQRKQIVFMFTGWGGKQELSAMLFSFSFTTGYLHYRRLHNGPLKLWNM